MLLVFYTPAYTVSLVPNMTSFPVGVQEVFNLHMYTLEPVYNITFTNGFYPKYKMYDCNHPV